MLLPQGVLLYILLSFSLHIWLPRPWHLPASSFSFSPKPKFLLLILPVWNFHLYLPLTIDFSGALGRQDEAVIHLYIVK